MLLPWINPSRMPGAATAAAFDFGAGGRVQERADKDDEAEDENVPQGRRNNDGANDVARDEEFQTEPNRTAEILPVLPVGVGGALKLEASGAASNRAW